MKETLQVIKRMRVEGVIGRYAIGGAIGAMFYIEPFHTLDLDVFIHLELKNSSPFQLLAPIYNYLLPLGYKAAGTNVIIEGQPVQFIVVPNPLYEEAVNESVEKDAYGEKVFVMTPEHLMAICLQTNRPKDLIRLEQFVNSPSKASSAGASPLRSSSSIVSSPTPINQTIVLNAGNAGVYDEQKLISILERHNLLEKWKQFILNTQGEAK